MRMAGVVMVCTHVDNYQLLLLYILCIDIDECLSGPCPSDLICNNMDGNYSCDCPDGTMRSGAECICKFAYYMYSSFVYNICTMKLPFTSVICDSLGIFNYPYCLLLLLL